MEKVFGSLQLTHHKATITFQNVFHTNLSTIKPKVKLILNALRQTLEIPSFIY